MPLPLPDQGSELGIRPSLRAYLRSRRVAVGLNVGLYLLALVGLVARLARLGLNGSWGVVTALAIVAISVSIIVGLTALAVLRGKVVATGNSLEVVGLFTTQQVPAGSIERVLFRTISYSGNRRKEMLVVGKSAEILSRIPADLYREDDLRRLVRALGTSPEGSWSKIIALGPIEGLHAAEVIRAKLATDPN